MKVRNTLYLFGIMFLALLFLLPTISAATFDNTIDFDKNTGQYGKYEIKDWFGLLKLQDLQLISNTETCNDKKCRAEIPINHYQDGILIEDIRFIDLDTNEETEIKSYQLKVDGNNYKIGTEIPKGDFNLEITGDLFGFQKVDWQIKTHGQWLDSWAVWSASLNVNLVAYHSFDINITDNAVSGSTLYDLDAYEGTPGLSGAGCVIGNCLNLTGNNNLRFPNGEGLYDLFSANKTWSLWAYKTPDDAGNTFIGSTSDECAFEWSESLSRFGWQNLKTGGGDDYSTPEPLGRWVHIVLTTNDTHLVSYVNGSIVSAQALWGGKSTTDVRLGTNAGNTTDWAGRVDEFGIWNRTLTKTEIEGLYNSGSGIAYVKTPTPIIVALNNPPNNTVLNNDTLPFTSTITISPAGLHDIKNATLYIWYNNQTLFNATTKVITGDSSNISVINMTGLVPEKYLWNVRGCAQNATTATCLFASENRSFSYGAIINKINWNATIYETETGTFTLNLTTPTSYVPTGGLLYYNGTQYSATITASGDEYLISRSFDIPVVPSNSQNRSFYFSYDLANTNFNLSTTQQNVTKIIFGGCNATIPDVFINFTFKEEENSSIISAKIDAATWEYWLGDSSVRKSLTYTNATGLKNFPFCFYPSDKTLYNNLTLRYSKSGYPQRIHFRESDLTDTPTNQLLYLLATADGIYSSIQVQDENGEAIKDVDITAERKFNGVWVTIGVDVTDDSGLITFWVNPNYDHRFTITKTGYVTSTISIRPSQSLYTVVLQSTAAEEEEYVSTLEGIEYEIYPLTYNILSNGTDYRFGFNIESNSSNLAKYYFNITNEDGTQVGSAIGNTPAGSNITIIRNTGTNDTFYGRFYVNIGGDDYLVEFVQWQILLITPADTSILKAFENLFVEDMNFEEHWSTLFIFFFILFLLMTAFTRFSGAELSTPSISLVLILAVTWIASFGGFFTVGFMENDFMNQFSIALVTTFFVGGAILNFLRK